MKQLAIWTNESPKIQKVINVSQIPQRSPLRYPGGKTWLVPRVRTWLAGMTEKPAVFIEPFVGGGIVSLTVAFEDLADHVIMIELDNDVAALWQTILSDDNDWLANRILDFTVTPDSVREELSRAPNDMKQRAFQTLIRNRTSHGGILAPGSGVLKHGESGKGIKSRWYPQTLYKRIQNIKLFRNKITFINGDGIAAIKRYAALSSAVFFIDPPYTAGRNGKRAGARLYTHSELDHEELFTQASRIKGDFLMTYDNAAEVVQMANRHSFATTTVSMMNTHHTRMQELMIGRDLSYFSS